ncbi:MAG: PEGA domain-containing protein [Nannocystales bacterium]
MSRNAPTAVAMAVVLLFASGANAAPAEEADATEQKAADHFRRGVGLYEEEDYAAAAFEFERAYEVRPDYRLLYNIGVNALELKDYASARAALSRYLEEGGADVEAARKAQVEQQLQTLAMRVGSVTVTSSRPGLSIWVDGTNVGETPLSEPLVLNLGLRHLVARDGGSEVWAEDIEVLGGSATELEVVFEATASEVPPAVVPLDTPPPTGPSRKVKSLRTATFVSLGVTAAAGIGLAIAGGLTLQADGELESELERFPANDGDLSAAQDRRGTLVTTSNVMLGVTAAFAAVTLGLGVGTAVAKRREAGGGSSVSLRRGGFVVRF